MSARRLTLAVAGHVDHGKTAVSLALTGVDTDRLPEERRRGLSILPGFAELPLPSGRPASLVDLPGHERFVRHMIAGSAGVDAALLCVAADDGPMPQTREHLDVLGLLDVPVAAVAVTFADRADPGPASAGVAALVSAPAVPVAAPDGTGVEDLRRTLDAALAPRPAPCRGEARLPVDRAFTVAGAGTVVTGTLLGVGGLATGDAVRVEPSGAAGRVRRIEVHDGAVERAVRGRVALNLGGIARAEVPPGSTVVPAGSSLRAVDRIEVDLLHLPASPRALRGRERLPAFVGTAEVTARLRLCGLPRLDPGRRAAVELRLERPAYVTVGDRVLVRTPDPLTAAGGVVVAVGAAPAPRREAPAAREPGVPDEDEVDAVEAVLRAAGPAGTPAGDIPAAVRGALRRRGRAGEARGLWFHEEALARAEAEALASWRDGPRALGDLRACWGVSRRSAEALANLLDARGVTRRVGSARVLRRGARARTPAP